MRVKCINRAEEQFTRERTQDLQKVHRNLDPTLHPFEKAIEYTRALNAVKLDRVFAKPFIAALPHSDGVTCLGRNPARLNSLLVGAADGTLRLWDVAAQRCLRQLVGEEPLPSYLQHHAQRVGLCKCRSVTQPVCALQCGPLGGHQPAPSAFAPLKGLRRQV